jgi:hypothetical protein
MSSPNLTAPSVPSAAPGDNSNDMLGIEITGSPSPYLPPPSWRSILSAMQFLCVRLSFLFQQGTTLILAPLTAAPASRQALPFQNIVRDRATPRAIDSLRAALTWAMHPQSRSQSLSLRAQLNQRGDHMPILADAEQSVPAAPRYYERESVNQTLRALCSCHYHSTAQSVYSE